MSIVLARIDNRLIHGQVLETWVPYVKANCIVVANDEVAGAPFQKLVMETAVPSGIRVVIAPVEEVARQFASGALRAERVLLLFANSQDALTLHSLGVDYQTLNLGNMHGGEGKRRVSCTIALNPVDIENFKCLENEGVTIRSQCVPLDREQNWRKMIRIMEG